MEQHGFVSDLHRRKPKGKAMPEHLHRASRTRSKHRAPIKQVLAFKTTSWIFAGAGSAWPISSKACIG